MRTTAGRVTPADFSSRMGLICLIPGLFVALRPVVGKPPCVAYQAHPRRAVR